MNATPPSKPIRLTPWLGLGVLLVGVLALIAWGKSQPITPSGPAHATDGLVLTQRALHFQDGPNGEVLVIDAQQGLLLATLEGEQGFVRQTLRAIARERMRRGITQQEPVWLQSLVDRRLVLLDPQTQTRIDLMAFGPSNSEVFARWLVLKTPSE